MHTQQLLQQNKLQTDAIVAYTNTGKSIEKLASVATECPVFAITDDEKHLTNYQ